MNVRQLAAAAALTLSAVAAHANVVSFYSFTLTNNTDVLVIGSTASTASSIVDFDLVDPVGITPVDIDNLDPTSWTLTFSGLTLGTTYKFRLETTAGLDSVSADAYDLSGPLPTSTSLAVSSVPEPESYALALAGLSVAGLLARRRKAA
jgi:1,4-alpha-glucan branching enzyme